VRQKGPQWECELWSYLSDWDGAGCPVYDQCAIRLRGVWCISDHRQELGRLLDRTQFDPANYDFADYVTPGSVFRLIERAVQKYVMMSGIVSPPVPTELATMFGNKEVIEIRELPLKVCSGATWHTEDGWVIHLNAHETPAEKRFTLFHEVFHILSHRAASRVPWQRRRKRGIFCELLADYFSACVLMPGQWIVEKWPEVQDLDSTAEMFDVPVREMWVRLRTLKLIGRTYPLPRNLRMEATPPAEAECMGTLRF
jgi:hypothetical protein